MFDIGFTELLLVGVVALVVVGPERLPGLIRTALGYIRQFKSSFSNIKSEVERELDLADLKKDLTDSKSSVSKAIGYDDLHQSLDELRKESKNLKNLADDDYGYTDQDEDDFVNYEKITTDLEHLTDTAEPQLPHPEAEAETGIEPEIAPAKKADKST